MTTTTPETAAPERDRTPGARPHGDGALRWIGVAAVSVPIVVVALRAWSAGWMPTADDALIELAVRDVPGHLPLVGVYSRFGFHHPGPLLFYVLAVPYRVLGVPGLLVGAALVNVAAATGTALLAFRHGGRRFGVVAVGALLVFEGASANALADVWNPWITVLPFAFVVVATWALWNGDDWLLPVLAGAASFVVQAHVAYALPAGLLLGAAAIVTTVRVARRERRARLLVLAAVVLAACWAPPLVDQVTASPGNLGALASSFRNPPEAAAGAGKAIDVAARALSVQGAWLTGDEELEVFSGRVLGVGALAVLPFALASVAAVVAAVRRERTQQLRLLAVVAATALAGVVAVSRITGEVFPYLVRWWWAIGMLAWAAVAWPLLDLAADRLLPPGRPPRWLRVGAASLIVAASLGTAVRAARIPMTDADLVPGAEAVADALAARFGDGGPLALRSEETSWAQVYSGIVARLERDGVDVVVPADLVLQYGSHRIDERIGEVAPDRRVVVVRGAGVTEHRSRGEVPLAEWEPLTPAERREADALTLRAGVEFGDRMAGHTPADPLSPAERDRLAALAAAGQPVAAFAAP